MKSALVGFAVLMVALIVIESAALRWGGPLIEPILMAPRVAFVSLPPLPATAYDSPAMWLAGPRVAADRADDPAQYLPPGVRHDRQGRAYVFFLHPTTFLGRNNWNAPLDHADSRMRAELAVRTMASVFNDEAAIYAPRYRQAAMGTFLIDRADSQRALALAEGDATMAFAAFLRAIPPTAPIVLAGHSQGALIMLRLLRDKVRGTPVADRVAAVYLAGWPVSPAHDQPQTGLPGCTRPDQPHCVMAWMSFARPADPQRVHLLAAHYPALDGQIGHDAPLCTNPLNGGAADAAPVAANAGSLLIGDEYTRAAMVRPSVGARCDRASGLLLITAPLYMGAEILSGNDYTAHDYALFWRNLRADVAQRTSAWQRRHSDT
ncbi:DUF3089 domain-containing protein [Novosphingobium sp.]|uniref:DUF3089 domain-containing protein n=1 Tax=Novosphingobium sp. TaxID=1874826 RepID=UPI00333F72E2